MFQIPLATEPPVLENFASRFAGEEYRRVILRSSSSAPETTGTEDEELKEAAPGQRSMARTLKPLKQDTKKQIREANQRGTTGLGGIVRVDFALVADFVLALAQFAAERTHLQDRVVTAQSWCCKMLQQLSVFRFLVQLKSMAMAVVMSVRSFFLRTRGKKSSLWQVPRGMSSLTLYISDVLAELMQEVCCTGTEFLPVDSTLPYSKVGRVRVLADSTVRVTERTYPSGLCALTGERVKVDCALTDDRFSANSLAADELSELCVPIFATNLAAY